MAWSVDFVCCVYGVSSVGCVRRWLRHCVDSVDCVRRWLRHCVGCVQGIVASIGDVVAIASQARKVGHAGKTVHPRGKRETRERREMIWFVVCRVYLVCRVQRPREERVLRLVKASK